MEQYTSTDKVGGSNSTWTKQEDGNYTSPEFSGIIIGQLSIDRDVKNEYLTPLTN